MRRIPRIIDRTRFDAAQISLRGDRMIVEPSSDKAAHRHFVHRVGWLRAAVLGANDGIVSMSSLIVGVAAASSDRSAMMVAGVAGLVSGTMSMAAGEYVSVSSQSDTEKADLETERQALETSPEYEHEELTHIYVKRGVEIGLARQVATQLMEHDALAAHAHDDLGLSKTGVARPVQAALASAASFSVGGLLPLIAASLTPAAHAIPVTSVASLIGLMLLGALSARAGGADVARSVIRVMTWGALAMGVTAGIGSWVGTAL
jgi:VIT1/CCC1 family predicted Fe2+/Mn2+ transporter